VAAALNAQPLLLGVAGLIAYCLHDIGEDLPPKGTAVVMCAPAPCNPRTKAATMCVGPSARYRMACSTLPPATLHSTQAATLCECRCAMALVAAATWPLAQKKGKKN